MIGRQIAHYRIEEKIGAGGMGEVYLAKDTSLDRYVALKFLPESLQNDPVALQRFRREAKTIGSLDHPHVCRVFEVSQTPEGQEFLVLEYVRGKTLREILASDGPLPQKKAVMFAAEIAEALESAHDVGIIHRDLKPANIMITSQGHAKVMDFGLAKDITSSDGQLTQTAPGALTAVGTTVGTLNYMSPEQIRGEELDQRTDIFSFGIVLFEMLTGAHPFRRSQPVQTANAILSEPGPSLSSGSQEYPPSLEHIIQKTLAKEKERRYQIIHEVRTDLALVLENALLESRDTVQRKSRDLPGSGRRKWVWPLVLVWVALWVATLLLWAPWREEAEAKAKSRGVRYSINLEEDQNLQFHLYSGTSIAVSPDGMNVAYTVAEGNSARLYWRRLDEFEAQPLLGTDGATSPFFSPDSKWLAFCSGVRLLKISLEGGTPQEITRIESHCNGGSWDSSDVIVFSDCEIGLKRVSAAGGDAELISQLKPADLAKMERDNRYPQILPGGEAVLFSLDNSPVDKRVAVRSVQGGSTQTLIKRGAYPRYVSSGHIVYAWEGALLAVPFDLKELKVSGEPVKVLEGVQTEDSHGAANFAVSDNGTLVYVSGEPLSAKVAFAFADLDGNVEMLPPDRQVVLSPRLAPDGKHILATRSNEFGRSQAAIYELERGVWTPLSDESESAFWAVWGPNGDSVIFNSTQLGKYPVQLVQKNLSGGPPRSIIPTTDYHQLPSSLSKDGRILWYQESETPTGIDIWSVDLTGQAGPQAVLNSAAGEVHPAVSPRGDWLAYASNESGGWEVYVRSLTPNPEKSLVSAGGGWEPLWAPDGGKIYFRDISGRSVFSVDFHPNSKPRVGKPQLLFEGPFAPGIPYGRMYDLSADGSRMLLLYKGAESAKPNQIRIVLGWRDELERLVPAE